jgi:hypothetical protein
MDASSPGLPVRAITTVVKIQNRHAGPVHVIAVKISLLTGSFLNVQGILLGGCHTRLDNDPEQYGQGNPNDMSFHFSTLSDVVMNALIAGIHRLNAEAHDHRPADRHVGFWPAPPPDAGAIDRA